ncbi:hypothetical protein LXL04_002349 [Taraxacum kok-saghyz]
MFSQWTKVRRRPEKGDNAEVISFFVNNIPKDTRRSDMWKPCSKLGKLVDIFIPGRRDAAGSFFAFVRYSHIGNTSDLIRSLNETTIGGRALKANVSRHPRNHRQTGRIPIAQPHPPHTHPPPPPPYTGPRSYADVTNGNTPRQAPACIKLKPIDQIKDWLNMATLIGEVRNFDLLCSFPSILEMEGYDVVRIKYLGGMLVSLKFQSPKGAEVFKDNKTIWMKWLTGLEVAGKKVTRFERISWIKVTGMPIIAWDDENFEAIAGNFGKVLVSARPFSINDDLSHGKICILTNSRIKIQEEIMAEVAGTQCRIGISEIDDCWFPFKPFSPAIFSASDDEPEDDNDEAVSATWINDLKKEEGEIPANSDKPEDSTMASVVGESTHAQAGLDEESHGGSGNPNHHIPTCAVGPIGSPILSSNGEIIPPATGPLPIPNTTLAQSSPEFNQSESTIKRRRIKKKKNVFAESQKHSQLGPQSAPMADAPRIIDLNLEIPCSQSSSEINQTVEFGAKLGFQFYEGSKAVGSALYGDGANYCLP